MIRRLWVLLAASLWVAATASAQAEELAQSFTDWALRCPEQAGCVLQQRVLLEDNPTPLLHVALHYSDEPRTLDAIIRVPLGVLLPPGLTIVIDGGQPMTIPFHHCLPEGCLALTQVSDPLADALRRGNRADVSYQLADRRTLTVPLSLHGITAGLRALRARMEP